MAEEIPPIVFPRRCIMRCSQGTELRQIYETAEQEKIAINSRRAPNTDPPIASEKEFSAAKQRYLESFADWLSHKAFCHDCRPKA
jgi:hypothetical protein